ncbi:hypothetical protein D5085_12025 [Ectothiorhodospiraceae bacterium BW-2]|nr:hypothetical protein D5085_12025 [Ectothiorhodospiraceae bacterium BW-2]
MERRGDYLVCRIAEFKYALPIEMIIEITESNKLQPTTLPNSLKHVRGIVNFRGEIIPIYDLRVFNHLPSYRDNQRSLCRTLAEREQDHRHWLQELENSVVEQRPFTLQTDPHQCEFGLWYDRFTTDNPRLEEVLRQFDRPHKAIHALAKQVEIMLRQGARQQALTLIEQSRHTTLSDLIALFEQARQEVSDYSREVVFVIEEQQQKIGITIDEIIDAITVQESDLMLSNEIDESQLSDCVISHGDSVAVVINSFAPVLPPPLVADEESGAFD